MKNVIENLHKKLSIYYVTKHVADTGSAYFRFPFPKPKQKVVLIRVGNHNANSNRPNVWQVRSDCMTKRYKNGHRIYNVNSVDQMLIDLEKVM
jgi:hypothetical protein